MGYSRKDLKDYGLGTNNGIYVIAEIGINHMGDIDSARNLIGSARRAGADAVKFQTYVTERRTHKGSPIFDILKRCELPFEAFRELKDYSSSLDIEFFSTPFDAESVDFLESIGCRIYKVSSFDVTNHALLSRVAATGKTVMMSVGMADMGEIQDAYNILKGGTSKVALLHCISAYPSRPEDADLAAIYVLKEKFDCLIGQSDHTNDIVIPLYAASAGAQVIEKHYKIDERMDCADAAVSITEKQMTRMVEEMRRLDKALGKGELGVRPAEKGCEIFRRKAGAR
ncbi:MAG: N-acetylneuraminate synthase family protein [Candidatus Omnitrophica bacterium]|nr:N-acetylneuraminate synthase family protein [Candidatus Omnitrophota bacterium]